MEGEKKREKKVSWNGKTRRRGFDGFWNDLNSDLIASSLFFPVSISEQNAGDSIKVTVKRLLDLFHCQLRASKKETPKRHLKL